MSDVQYIYIVLHMICNFFMQFVIPVEIENAIEIKSNHITIVFVFKNVKCSQNTIRCRNYSIKSTIGQAVRVIIE